MIFSFELAAISCSKPALRSIAGADPTVPCNSTIFNVASGVFLARSSSQRPARRPSSTKSEPMNVTYSDLSVTLTARSVRMTGILAALASRSTVSQPDSTTGENAITSTFCAMNERIALTWFSCFCCASANFSVTPSFCAASLIDAVLAVRHSLSAPTCEKPITIGFAAKALPARPIPNPSPAVAASATVNAPPNTVLRVDFITCLRYV